MTDTLKGFWMQKAYLVPKDAKNGNERPDSLGANMEPINKMDVRSLFVSPEPGKLFRLVKSRDIRGVAFDGGDGISKVEVSKDSGKTWLPLVLGDDLGKYSWRHWQYDFTPPAKGIYYLQVKATNSKGETQPVHQWNRSGYMRNETETLMLKAE